MKENMKEHTTELSRRMGSLFAASLRLSHPVSQLHLIREKMAQRGYQAFDKEDIMSELGNLQHIAGELHAEMLRIHDLLKQQHD
jgi:hypothetical protein